MMSIVAKRIVPPWKRGSAHAVFAGASRRAHTQATTPCAPPPAQSGAAMSVMDVDSSAPSPEVDEQVAKQVHKHLLKRVALDKTPVRSIISLSLSLPA